jgi:hypothetical protein
VMSILLKLALNIIINNSYLYIKCPSVVAIKFGIVFDTIHFKSCAHVSQQIRSGAAEFLSVKKWEIQRGNEAFWEGSGINFSQSKNERAYRVSNCIQYFLQ